MAGRLDPAVADVRRAIRVACADLEPGARVLVACSGGADSMALAAGAVFEGRHAGWQVGAVTVDHQLQQASAQVAAEVVERLRALGCDPVDMLPIAVGSTGGPEGAARTARYTALEAHSAKSDAVVLLGHTRDDQAESVLLALARGSGTRSLAGMPARRDPFRRPLLALPRATTEQACRAQGLAVWTDPHNSDDRFARVRVRHDVLPLLESTLGPGIAEALARTADLARDDADALDALALDVERIAGRGAGSLDVAALSTVAVAIRRRVLRRTAIRAGCPAGDLTAHHVAEIDRLITHWHGQAHVALPGQVVATRDLAGTAAQLHFTSR